MLKLWGIKNCDTVRKARKWLEQHGIDYTFYDFRADDLTQAQLKRWVDALGWEVLLNKRGTTFRQLSDDDKASLNKTKATKLMLSQPTLIKRPVVEHNGNMAVGFSLEAFEQYR